jgi:hypothetical protein
MHLHGLLQDLLTLSGAAEERPTASREQDWLLSVKTTDWSEGVSRVLLLLLLRHRF